MASMTTRKRSVRRSCGTPRSGCDWTRCPWTAPRSKAELDAVAGDTITPDGMGGLAALKLFEEQLALACLSTTTRATSPSSRARRPRPASLFDLVVGASSIYGGSWLEGAGAVYAENQALRWIADLAGLPAGGRRRLRAGRHDRQPVGARRRPGTRRGRGAPRPAAAARRRWGRGAVAGPLVDRARAREVMDVDVVVASRPTSSQRLTGDALRAALEADGADDLLRRRRDRRARRTSASSTTSPAVADVCARVRPLAARRRRVRRRRPGRAVGAPPLRRHRARRLVHRRPAQVAVRAVRRCALLYRDPALARAAHTQNAGYLDVLTDAAGVEPVRLRRPPDPPGPRAAVLVLPRHPRHPTPTPRAIERTLEVARVAAAEIARRARTSSWCASRDLSVVVFRRIGWTPRGLLRVVRPAACADTSRS